MAAGPMHPHDEEQNDTQCIATSTLIVHEGQEIEVHRVAAPRPPVHKRVISVDAFTAAGASDARSAEDVESVCSTSYQRMASSKVYDNRPQFSAMAQRKHSKMFLGHTEAGPAMQAEDDFEGAPASGFLSKFRLWRPKVILPHERWYKIFWNITLMYALLNAAVDPYKVAFGQAGGFEPYNDVWAVLEYIGTVLFFVDIVLKFFVAYEDTEHMEIVTEHSKIVHTYLRLFFWLDLLFWFPFVGAINAARPQLAAPSSTVYSDYAELPDSGTNAALYVGLLSFLKLGRLYRIFYFFDQLEHSMVMSQMALMLTRNFFYILLTCHWFACVFYFTARVEHFSPERSWVGRRLARFDGQSPATIYTYSFYLSVISFTSLGDSDFFCNSPAESIIMSIYLLFNVVLGAYILGTVTMLMVKGDERSSKFRDRITSLKTYSHLNELPSDLQDAMRKHIELHFQSELSSDELVLAMYPAAIKKRVLRHMYLQPLKECYIFKSSAPKFLDAVLAVCRTDMFMPNVQLITEGDIVSDLSLVIDGEVEVIPMSGEGSSSGPSLARHLMGISRRSTDAAGLIRAATGSNAGKARRSSFFVATADIAMSTTRGAKSAKSMQSMGASGLKTRGEKRGTSETFGEVAFFTESPSTDAVWTCTVTRVLVLPRAAYNDLVKAYPNQVRHMLGAVFAHAEKAMIQEFMDVLETIPVTTNSVHMRLLEFFNDEGTLSTLDLPSAIRRELQAIMNTEQLKKMGQMEVVKQTYKRFCAKQDQALVVDLLNYAKHGEVVGMATLLDQGVDPSCADFDHRSPLMIASRDGQEAIVRMLLAAGANVHAQDSFGNTALCEAVKKGRDDIVALLLEAGAKLNACSHAIREFLIQAVMTANVELLVKLLQAGADPNIVSHDKRSLLHLAAAQGNLRVVELLVEAGARAEAVDRWNQRPMDDAHRFKANDVVEFLRAHTQPRDLSEGIRKLAASSVGGRQSMIHRKTMRRRRVSGVNMPPQAPPRVSGVGHQAFPGQALSTAPSLARGVQAALTQSIYRRVQEEADPPAMPAPPRYAIDLSPIETFAVADEPLAPLESQSADEEEGNEQDGEDESLEAQLAVAALASAMERLAADAGSAPILRPPTVPGQGKEAARDVEGAGVAAPASAEMQPAWGSREAGPAVETTPLAAQRQQHMQGDDVDEEAGEGEEMELGLSSTLMRAQLAVAAASASDQDKLAWPAVDLGPGNGAVTMPDVESSVEPAALPRSSLPGCPSLLSITEASDGAMPDCAASPRLAALDVSEDEGGAGVQPTPAVKPAS